MQLYSINTGYFRLDGGAMFGVVPKSIWNKLNPADENGARRVTINAVGFPTTIRYQFSMGNTGLRFANLMRTVCYLHGGAFIALQDL